MNKPTSEDYEILWKKGSGVTRVRKQIIKHKLNEKKKEIIEAMDVVKKQSLDNGMPEIRIPLMKHFGNDYYLVVEYGADAWHLFLETDNDCLGEIIQEGGPFIRMLDDKEVET